MKTATIELQIGPAASDSNANSKTMGGGGGVTMASSIEDDMDC